MSDSPLPQTHHPQLSQTNDAVEFRGGDAAPGLMDTGARMPRHCLPDTSLRLQAGKSEAEVGPGVAWSPGEAEGGGRGGGGAGRDGPSLLLLLLLLEPVKLHSHFPQELPFHLPAPGACKAASVCLQRLSPPCAPSLPAPLQLRAPGPGRPEPSPAHGAGAAGGRGRGGGTRGAGGSLGIPETRPWPPELALSRRAPGTACPGAGVSSGTQRGSPAQGKAPGLKSFPRAGRIPCWSEVGRPLCDPG